MCLAHKIGSYVERTYAQSNLFKKRRKLMCSWSDFVANTGVFEESDAGDNDL